MTSSMLAPANADPSCRSESSSGSSASSVAACFPVRLPVEVAGSGSLAAASTGNSSSHAKATTTTPTLKQECSGSTTTDTGGLVLPSSSHQYTVHHQPPLRSHVNLLHHNSELSINTLSSHSSTQLQTTADPMQQAAATDYFRPYLHTNPYPHTPGGSVGGVAAVHPGHPHMTPMAPHPASMHSPYATAAVNTVHYPGSRLAPADPAAAMAAAAAVSAAAAAVAANNNSPTYKGPYQDLYSNNNPTTLELSQDASNAASASSLSDQQYPASGSGGGQPRMFPARPQPTRPVMVGAVATAGSPKPPKESSMQPPPSSPVQLNNNNNNNISLTPPPSVVTHHRSQQSLSKSSVVAPSNSNLGPSAALYRDKLGLNSPSSAASAGGTTPPSGIPPALSPAADHSGSSNANSTSAAIRRLSGNSGGTAAGSSSAAAAAATGNTNPKFRYPSGPSSSSSPPPPATPSSAMSSREGTPLPPTQRPEDGAPPNVDISRVQIAENNSDSVIKREQPESQQQSMLLGNAGIKREQSESMTGIQQGQGGGPPPLQPTQQQQQVSQASQQQHAAAATAAQFGAYTPATSTSPSTFSAQYPYLAQQHQQHHHMGWQPQPYYSSHLDGTRLADGTNNNLIAGLSRSSSVATAHLGAAAAAASAMGGYGSSYADHSQYQYGTTIHHYGDPTTAAQHSGMASAGSVLSRTGPAGPSGVGRGRGHHHSGNGNGVKIGRRPAHLPKVLKFQDKTLPPGWIRKLKCRKHGKQAGRWDVYIYSPCGVKFASKKKLKAFFEKNQLNYDIEEFDFTPYGRHTDNGSARSSGNSGGAGAGSSGNSAGSGASGGGSSSNTGAGRHNSSGSTGSEGTHTGGSPASLHNYSPTHHHALHSSGGIGSASTPTSSSSYMPQSMMTSTSSLYGPMATASSVADASSAPPSGSFSTFSTFDPLMENPPNKMCPSVEDLPTSSSGTAATVAAVAASATDFTASSLVGGATTAFGVKFDTPSDCFPAEMAEILGSSPSVNSLSNGLTGSAFGPPHGLSSSSDPYSDLSRSLHHAGSLHPLSNASLESRGSTEEEGDESGLSSQRPENKVSGLSKAFRALNDFGSVYSFE